MTPINILKAQAAAKRNAIIAQAQLQYRQDLDAIRVLMKQLKPRKPRTAPRQAKIGIRSDAYGGMTTIQACRLVLADGKPRRPAEIVLEMQARGIGLRTTPTWFSRPCGLRSGITGACSLRIPSGGGRWRRNRPFSRRRLECHLCPNHSSTGA